MTNEPTLDAHVQTRAPASRPYTLADLEQWLTDDAVGSVQYAFRTSVVRVLWRRFGGTAIPPTTSIARELGMTNSTVRHQIQRGLVLLREPARQAQWDIPERLVGTLLGAAVQNTLRRGELAWATVRLSTVLAHPVLSLSARSYLPERKNLQHERDPETDPLCEGARLNGAPCAFLATIWSPATGYCCGHHYRKRCRETGEPEGAVAIRDKEAATL